MKFLKKSLGQNFLIDQNIIRKIINVVEVKNRHIVEIGPGDGALTKEILNKKPKSLVVIEKDSALVSKLKLKFLNERIEIINDDILKFDLERKIKKKSIIFGNLPYNISSQILVKLLKFKIWPPYFSDLVLMFQKELSDKITGKYLSAHYGRLYILSNYRMKIIKKFLVSKNCFFPKPKITSQIIHLCPKTFKKNSIKDLNNLEKITNILFSNKRKMINKNIKKILNEKEINNLIDLRLDQRPENIKPEMYYKIAELYERKS